MFIKRKLTLSYIAMLLIPIILFLFITLFVANIFKDTLKSSYNIGYGGPLEDIIQKDSIAINNIKSFMLSNKNSGKNNDFFKKQESYLKEQTGIVIRKNNNFLYMSPFLKNSVTSSILPKFGEYDDISRRHSQFESKSLLLKQYDFSMDDGSKVSIFLVLNTVSAENIVYKFFAIEILILIAILIITNGILTFLVSKSIVNPLEKLKNGAVLIKNGNMDFQLNINSNDEIGELSKAFEEMRKRLRESLEIQLKYENNRKELISNISHDLKTPVTAIKGYIEGIKDGVADSPEKMQRYINTVYKKATDMDKLIDELFLFSKLDLKKIPFSFEKVDLLDYLNDCLEELKFDLEKKGINIMLEDQINTKVYVVADREKLKRVIMNIVENSVKYIGERPGEIYVKIEKGKEYLSLSFKDNGIGISKQALPYIFDRFYRADLSRNSNTGGSGLGLAISKRIVEEHGGKIWAESSDDAGTNIIFTLKNWSDDYIEKDTDN